MVDLWMSARKDLREVIPPSNGTSVESLRASRTVTIPRLVAPESLPIAPVAAQALPSTNARTMPEQPVPVAAPMPVKKNPAATPNPGAAQAAGTSRRLDVVKTAISIAQKVLPLLEGNVGQTVSNLLSLGTPLAATTRDVARIQDHLTKQDATHLALADKVSEQKDAIVQLADRLDQLKEATNRNTLEQQEMMEDARALRKKFIVAGFIIIGLLVASVSLNIFVLLKLAH